MCGHWLAVLPYCEGSRRREVEKLKGTDGGEGNRDEGKVGRENHVAYHG